MSKKEKRKKIIKGIVRGGNRAGRTGPGQQWAGPKPGRAKIGPVFSGQNFNSPARPKNRAGRAKKSFQGKKKFRLARPYRAGPYWARPNLARFFQANNLMAQPGPNSRRTGLAHRVEPILPPLGIVEDLKWGTGCLSCHMPPK